MTRRSSDGAWADYPEERLLDRVVRRPQGSGVASMRSAHAAFDRPWLGGIFGEASDRCGAFFGALGPDGVGGFLGFGEKNMAVDYDYLQKNGGIIPNRVTLGMSEEDLRNAPKFERSSSSANR